MAKPRRRNRSTNQSTFVGALVIESLAIIVMIGLFFFIQGEREKSHRQHAEELIRPVQVEEQIELPCRFCEQPRETVYSVLEYQPQPHPSQHSRGHSIPQFELARDFGRPSGL